MSDVKRNANVSCFNSNLCYLHNLVTRTRHFSHLNFGATKAYWSIATDSFSRTWLGGGGVDKWLHLERLYLTRSAGLVTQGNIERSKQYQRQVLLSPPVGDNTHLFMSWSYFQGSRGSLALQKNQWYINLCLYILLKYVPCLGDAINIITTQSLRLNSLHFPKVLQCCWTCDITEVDGNDARNEH